jgi:hypothetical protein
MTSVRGRAKYELWRPDTGEWAMRRHLGAVAAIVIDGEKAPGSANNGSPVCDQARGSTEHLGRSRSRKTRFWRPR